MKTCSEIKIVDDKDDDADDDNRNGSADGDGRTFSTDKCRQRVLQASCNFIR